MQNLHSTFFKIVSYYILPITTFEPYRIEASQQYTKIEFFIIFSQLTNKSQWLLVRVSFYLKS